MPDPRSVDLSVLLRAVCVARSEVNEARHAKASPGSSRTATEQRMLLTALERYAAALTSRGSPMPYRMRDEMAMYRAMFGSPRQP